MDKTIMECVVIADGNSYKLATIIESHKNHSQIELFEDKTKKKIKQNQIIFTITEDIKNFNQELQATVPQIDIPLLSELINENEKNSLEILSSIYFGDDATLSQKTSLLFKLADSHIEFHNYQDGSFSKCSNEEQQQRLLSFNKQKQAQEQYQYYRSLFVDAIDNNSKLDNPDIDVFKTLHKPDKHSAIYKVLHHLAIEYKSTPLEIFHKVGLVNDLAEFFITSFTRDNSFITPEDTEQVIDTTTLNQRFDLKVFSIDDSSTTEIDDAFSVEITDNGYIIGIHIAAPALDTSLNEAVANNISTIYYPGNKITMLPMNIINKYSLWEQTSTPVVSIFFNLDSELNILEYTSSLNMVKIDANLRIEALENLFNQENLEVEHGYPYESELKLLYKLACILEEKRGKPSVNNLFTDYSFNFVDNKIEIKPRIRGNPIDKLVSELMILANCSWGRMLTNSFIPAIYRVKQPNYPVKMTLSPDSHTGLNVDYYTWSTSPLRRSADFINQKQIISMINKSKDFYTIADPDLCEVVDNFDTKYAKYIDFQNKMERYWSLKYLIQEKSSEIEGTFLYKSTVSLSGVPIQIDVANFSTPKPKGTKLRLKIYNINLSTINFDFKIISIEEV
jgi:exoribonuclease-2